MEKQYSVQFFTSFVENLQDVCRNYLDFNQCVEVSGYVCVEIDNMKKERYVLSELLQSSGNVVSESYCTKAFKTSRPMNSGNAGVSGQSGDRSRLWMNRNSSNTQGSRENVQPHNANRRRSWTDSYPSNYQNVPSKVRRSSEIIQIDDDNPVTPRRENRNQSSQYYSPQTNIHQGQKWSSVERASAPRTLQNPASLSRASESQMNQIRQQGQFNPMSRTQHGQMASPEQRPVPRSGGQCGQILSPEHRPLPSSGAPYGQMASSEQRPALRSVGGEVVPPTPAQGPGKVGVSNSQGSKQTAVVDHGNIEQFNVKPLSSPVSNVIQVPAVKSELYSDESRNVSPAVTVKLEQQNSCTENSSFLSSASTSSFSSNNSQNSEQSPNTPAEMDKKIKSEPVAVTCSFPSGFDEDEIIDLDLFDDELDDVQPDVPSPAGSRDDQSALARDYGMSSASVQPGQRIDGMVNRGTQKVVMYAVKLFKTYHLNKSGSEPDPFSVEPEQLDELLLDFYQGARKMNGDELNARTLKNVQIHLDMYLRQQGYCHSIAKDEKFQASRDFVKKRLDNYISTQKNSACTPVDDNDIEQLFQKRVLGAHNPDTLFNTMWFLNTKFLALRRQVEHFNLKWGDIQVKTDPTGLEYLERRLNDMCSLKVFAKPNNPTRCFVNMYRKYYQLRPQESLYDTCPFYLTPKGPNLTNYDFWFLNQTVSWSRFQNIWRKLVVTAGLPPNKKIF